MRAAAEQPAYPRRFDVPDEKVEWEEEWAEYSPVEFVHAEVTRNNREALPGGWADPHEPDRQLIEQRGSYEIRKSATRRWAFARDGRPLNPRGRTGMRGRGRKSWAA